MLKSKKRPAAILIDSSGLKILGQGEWRTKRFGKEGKRGWLKVHVAVDPDTHLIHSLKVTTDEIGDATMLPILLNETPKSVKEVAADKGYDTRECRGVIHRRGAKGLIPPRNGAIISDGDTFLEERDCAIKFCNALGGDEDAMRLWRKCSGYSIRALVETAFSRWKTVFGERVRSRRWENQETEVYVKQLILNNFTKLGMPRRGFI
jgi:Transposase DDE domain.